MELVGGIEVMHDQFDELVKKSLNFDVGRGNVCLSKKFCENIQGHFGHLTCKDVNVIFEVFEGILVILHESSRV